MSRIPLSDEPPDVTDDQDDGDESYLNDSDYDDHYDELEFEDAYDDEYDPFDIDDESIEDEQEYRP